MIACAIGGSPGGCRCLWLLRSRVFHGADRRRSFIKPEAIGAVENPRSCRRPVTGLVLAVMHQ